MSYLVIYHAFTKAPEPLLIFYVLKIVKKEVFGKNHQIMIKNVSEHHKSHFSSEKLLKTICLRPVIFPNITLTVELS